MTGKQEWRRDVWNRTASSSASAPARTQLHLEGEQKTYSYAWQCYLVRSESRGRLRGRNALMLAGKEAFHCTRTDSRAMRRRRGRNSEGKEDKEEYRRERQSMAKSRSNKEKGLSGALPHHFLIALLNILWHGSSHYTLLHPPPPSTRGPGDVKQAEAIRDLTIIHRDGKRQSIRTQGALTQVNTRQALNRTNGDGYKQHRCVKARKKRHALIHGRTNTEHSCILHAQILCVFLYISK